MEKRLAQTASGRGREYVTEISGEWKFGSANTDASNENYDDSEWETVDIPHTWNAADGADGGSNYKRTSCWYRKTISFDTIPDGKRIYVEFLGANQKTDLYVNGVHIKLNDSDEYTHKGGYTAFRYDVTDALKEGANMFAVKVDNTHDEEIAPISADFNMYGGIYRRIYIVEVNNIHVDLNNNGSSGLFLTTPNIRSKEMPDDLGALNIKADIINDSDITKTVTVTAHITGDNAPEDITDTVTIPANSKVAFEKDTAVSNPHLWNGIDYSGETDNSDIGYRYTVELTVSENGTILDKVSDKVGFRYFYIDKETGFYLNGKSYPLRGVNRHQFKERLGSALTEADHDEDMEIIKDLGTNTLRLCHYPQTDYFYDLCDENGIIVWTEIPLVNALGTSEKFADTTKQQLTELIRQQYNRPSVCFWGLENEIGNGNGDTRSSYITAKKLISELDALAHSEDASGRYTTQAINRDKAMDQNDPSNLADDHASIGWKSDVAAWNVYPGWYNDSNFTGTFQEVADRKTAQDSRPMALSEYGWGGSVSQHELYPELGKNGLNAGGKWHPEEYQSLMHEQAMEYINENDFLWGVYVWSLFDFDVDSRNEGSRIAQNDKGLVTNDRKIKKDSFYLYKANWDKRAPFVHITSSRFSERESSKTYVKVYSNCSGVELLINGESKGAMKNQGSGIFKIDDIDLSAGSNTIRAVGTMDDENAEDSCVWTRL